MPRAPERAGVGARGRASAASPKKPLPRGRGSAEPTRAPGAEDAAGARGARKKERAKKGDKIFDFVPVEGL